MTDEINNWINGWKKKLNGGIGGIKNYRNSVVPKIYCIDGFNVSIQASPGHYCSPREEDKMLVFDYDDSNTIHTAFELGFPSEKDILILKYAEEEENPTATVYGWVPLELVLALISKHGGIDYKKTFEEYAKKGDEQ